ncbi:MAG: hypothetical protein QNJ34_13555 [Xenococcaceae cyanobacterium MO_188.B29]|nr:hypothetical protein [Xenococcaceae cyanobacterium MO_188.B29]
MRQREGRQGRQAVRPWRGNLAIGTRTKTGDKGDKGEIAAQTP